ncbi:MAG TPA: FtsX-like permease family protein [Candidatus Angelobacter sp.]|nr:FtsX-like permease family protein [Candidatus Angelobacter sp.]
MKFLGLIRANLFRKKIRLFLTLGSFAVAMCLFGLLFVIREGFNQGIDVAGADRLIAYNRVGLVTPLPLSYRDRIMQIPGVTLVTHQNWFGGVYQDPKNFFPQFVIDPETQRKMYPEFSIPDDQWQNFVKDRQGAIVGAFTANKFGWKVGDRIPIQGTFLPGTWEFNIDGIYHGTRAKDDETQFWFQWDNFENYLETHKIDRYLGMVGWYTIKVDNPDNSLRVAKAVDALFSNSDYETHTDSEANFAAGFAKQMGNIQFLILSIGSIVFFTLLLVTGNTMAIAVRERTSELAVLKAVGYSDRFVLFLVLSEAALIAIVGGVFGLALAKGFTLLPANVNPVRTFLPLLYLSGEVFAIGIAAALSVGLISGFFPALGAMRLRVVDALRRV